ncbi:MAG: hypothetical protein ACI8QT_002225 [Halioglobus sp.]|jgi:hypothetical protein
MSFPHQALIHFLFRPARRIETAPGLVKILKSLKQVVAHHYFLAIPLPKGGFFTQARHKYNAYIIGQHNQSFQMAGNKRGDARFLYNGRYAPMLFTQRLFINDSNLATSIIAIVQSAINFDDAINGPSCLFMFIIRA